LLVWADPAQLAGLVDGSPLPIWPPGPGALTPAVLNPTDSPAPYVRRPGAVFSVLPFVDPLQPNTTFLFCADPGQGTAFTLIIVGEAIDARRQPLFGVGGWGLNQPWYFWINSHSLTIQTSPPTVPRVIPDTPGVGLHVWVVRGSTEGYITVRRDGVELWREQPTVAYLALPFSFGTPYDTDIPPLPIGYDVFHLKELQYWDIALSYLDVNALEQLLLNRFAGLLQPTNALITYSGQKLLTEDGEQLQTYSPPA